MNNNGHVKKGGGVAIYVSSKWSPYVSNDNSATSSTCDIEILTINVKTPGRRHMLILTVYRSPAGNCIEFITKLTNIVERLRNNNPEI